MHGARIVGTILGMTTALRILVIDDNRLIADSLVKMLRVLGHDPGAVYGPMPAMQLLGRVVPDLIFVDLHMQVVNGIEVCRYVRREAHLRHVPIVGISSDNQPDLIHAFMEAGAVAFIPKPVTLDALEQVLTTLFDPQARQAEVARHGG